MLSNKEIVCPNNLLDQAHKKKGVNAAIVNAGLPLPMLSVQDAVNENLIIPIFIGDKKKILKCEDFADLASDELTGSYDIIKGERVKIQGYLEDFALSKEESDELIMSARNIVYKD